SFERTHKGLRQVPPTFWKPAGEIERAKRNGKPEREAISSSRPGEHVKDAFSLVKAELGIVDWRRGSAHRHLNTALPRRNLPNDHDGKDPRFGRLGSTLPVAPG